MPFCHHLLELMDSDALPLRQLSAAGLFFQLSCIIEHGQANEGITSAIAKWLGAPGCGERLLQHLALGHVQLDQLEANSDKRGGGAMAQMSRMLNMTFEVRGRREAGPCCFSC